MSEHLVVAIDGPAGSGKSTVAARVADALGARLLDTGALYRAVALAAREGGVPWDDGLALARLIRGLRITQPPGGGLVLDGRDVSAAIRTPEISMGASRVSGLPEVREALLDLQRSVARQGPVVAEGRDMGTVVFPDATVKAFLVADPEERARRRYLELRERSPELTLEQVLADQNARDAADSQREVAPLRPADDAHLVDTSRMSIAEVVEAVLALVSTEKPAVAP